MDDLFSKYKKIKEEDFVFLKAVLEKTNYSFIVDDLNRELFASKKISEKDEMYGYVLTLFYEKAKKIEKKRKLGHFILTNIYVKDSQGKNIRVELEFIDGILRYYHFDTPIKIKNIDLGSVNIENIKEIKYSNSHKPSKFDISCEKNSIDHRCTKPFTPKTNGMVEKANDIINNATIKKTKYDSINQMREGLTKFLIHYNLYRRHGSLRRELKVKTPYDAIEKWYELDSTIFKRKPLLF